MPRTAVVWFRRDLRVHDHPALSRAVAEHDRVVPLFVVDDRLLVGRWASANRAWHLAGALERLADAIAERGGTLAVVRGDPRSVVVEVAREVGATTILATRDLSPYARGRDEAVAAASAAHGIAFLAGRGQLVHEPEELRRDDGGPYAVFSPFQRRWEALPIRDPLEAPVAIRSDPLPSAAGSTILEVLGDRRPTADPELLLEPGEPAARRRLARWATSDALRDYDQGRDRLAEDGTSRLSQDLRWGTLSPVEVLERCAGPGRGRERFRAEIAWRDFYTHLLWREPSVLRRSFRREFDALSWSSDDQAVQAWREGRTGYPIVDAAMRQLLATGWMHNRARMIAASFLTKHLLVDWRVGEAHFMEHLVDGDPASNNGGWQWAASTGTDPQPYFRIFNPTLQGRRHDPDGSYVRRWVPELAGLTGPDIHEPPPGRYLEPIIEHGAARRRALDAYGAARSSAGG
ncbi:MAG TPA: deoxyribodipyrimidine photo-lyase [Candidatus Limnocylindrales bacterium]|nr:deoxyribodipyrimidine photo-lyase [Candidatus Limnocylindrales bacterium]